MVNVLSIFLVGALWGCTNPFVKRARARLVAIEKASREGSSVLSNGKESMGRGDKIAGGSGVSSCTDDSTGAVDFLLSLVKHPTLAAPFIINQLGSLLFYYLLATENVSLVSPLCNSLALAFTALTGYCLGEEYRKPVRMFVGVVCVYLGVFLCSS
jgi:hypothetical protein